MKLVNIGYGNMVSAERVLAVVSSESSPVRRMIQDARASGRLIDATLGRKTQSVLVLDSGHLVLASMEPSSVSKRLVGKEFQEIGEEDA